MNNLLPHSSIQREQLEEERYLHSLLSAALQNELVTPSWAENFRLSCMELLADQCRRYTGGESSSVRAETAEELTASMLFTLGVWLKGYVSPDEALKALTQIPVAEGFQLGLLRVRAKVRSTRRFHAYMEKRMLPIKNDIYRDTFFQGIDGFFKRYDPEYSGHLIHITADYPLTFWPSGLEGIEFIEAYLQGADDENRFCRAFHPEEVQDILALYARNCGEKLHQMICNFFEIILAAALAAALAGENPLVLTLPSGGKQRLKNILSGKDDTAQILLNGWKRLQKTGQFEGRAGAYAQRTVLQNPQGIARDILLLCR